MPCRPPSNWRSRTQQRQYVAAPGLARLHRFLASMDIEMTPAGTRHRYVFGLTWTDGGDFMGAPARLDVIDGKMQIAAMAACEHAGECVPVRKRRATSDQAAWLLTVVLNSASRCSELRIYDGANLSFPRSRRRHHRHAPHHALWLPRFVRRYVITRWRSTGVGLTGAPSAGR